MAIVNDLTDKLARLAISYGRHAVKGYLTKHQVDIVGTEKQITVQRALGAGPWDSREKLYYGGEEINAANSTFHQGLANDAPDAYFPSDIAHPNAAYEATRLPVGMGNEDQPDRMVGIYKTLQVADYDGAGVQTAFDYSPRPARHVLDLMLRAKRSITRVNYDAWVAWRDYCATLINWDDGALTPHFVQLAASAGGSLAPGTYWVRIATIKDADLSSASKDRANDGVTTASVVISGGNLQFQATWASQAERGATGYRVYIGTAEGAEDRYFTVGSGATNTLLVTTLTGATMGAPPNTATGALLRQVPRFESHLFFVPPFDLSTALDRIAQITCMDWQYSNGKLVFLTPEVRSPIFTLNLAEANSFKTYQVDRRQKPNQIIVNYRNLDSEFLEQADPPVIIPHPGTSPSDPRMQLQAKEGIRPFEINGGSMYRSQAERVGNYWYRRLVESDQMLEIFGSPKTYIVLPGDPINVTHDVPNWTDIPFYIEEKEETEDVKAGYQLKGRIYPPGGWYSDVEQNPLPRPLPVANPNEFIAPPQVASVVLSQFHVLQPDQTVVSSIRVAVQFAGYVGRQRGRVYYKKSSEADALYKDAGVVEPDPETLQGAFEIRGVEETSYDVKVVSENNFISAGIAGATAYTIVIEQMAPPSIVDLEATRIGTTVVATWSPGIPLPNNLNEIIELYRIRIRKVSDNSVVRTHDVDLPDAIPCKWTYFLGGGDQGEVHMDEDGTIETDSGQDLFYDSQPFTGDFSLEWEVDDRHMGTIALVQRNPTLATGVNIVDSQNGYITIEGASFTQVRIGPLTRFRIDVKNSQAEFFLDGSFERRSIQASLPPVLVVSVSFTSSNPESQAFLRTRVRPYMPRQFVYTTEMQETDFPAGVPATVILEAVQVGINGSESDPVSVVI